MENTLVKYDSIEFNKSDKTFTILNGSTGTYLYTEIVKCSVLNEDSKFRGKTDPFEHQVLGGTAFLSMLGEPSLYVGLKLTMRDNTVLGVYISKEKTFVNSDVYNKDREEAESIKLFIEKIIEKYQ